MDQPPQKRRWQFSLKVLLIVITMAGVGMGLIRLVGEHNVQKYIVTFLIGYMLLTASPGVLIGYGFNRLRGAIIGGVVIALLITILMRVALELNFLLFS